jgi:hypothetical protein
MKTKQLLQTIVNGFLTALTSLVVFGLIMIVSHLIRII